MADQFLMRATTMDDIVAAINKYMRAQGYTVGEPDKHGEFPIYDAEGGLVTDFYVLKCPADFRLFKVRG